MASPAQTMKHAKKVFKHVGIVAASLEVVGCFSLELI